jgi:hypothetical protein
VCGGFWPILLQKSQVKGVWAAPRIFEAGPGPSFDACPIRSGSFDALERYKLIAVFTQHT